MLLTSLSEHQEGLRAQVDALYLLQVSKSIAPPWGTTRKLVALLLQVLWVPVSINVRQYRQQHCDGEDSYSNTDHYSNKEEAECFFRLSHMVLEQILLMKFNFQAGNLAKSS